MSALEKRSVTSSLIFKFPDDDESQRPQLALFRRSDKVRTYQNKYGLISGSIEPSDPTPLACAWRELREETSLASPPLHLLRRGRPFRFQDAGVGREWTVHPFMFKLDAARAGDIAIDWEHSGHAWVDPDDVDGDGGGSVDGVPRLAQSLRSVWFEAELGARAGGVLAEGLRELRGDYESGARELAAKAMRIYAATATALAEDEDEDEDAGEEEDQARRDRWWRCVRLAGWHLWKNGRESMGAAVANLVLAVLAALEGEFRAAPSLAGCARAAIARVCGASELSRQRVRESFRAVLEQLCPASRQGEVLRILTLSSSSTVTACLADALAEAAGRPLDIRVLESRPLFEGVETARRLAALCASPSEKSTVTVFTDASAAVAARGAHFVLLGADAIDASANVSNKTGSLPAVLAAKHVSPGVGVVVVSETAKVLPFDAPDEERSNVEEMAGSWRAPGHREAGCFAVENILFEWVDAALVDHFVTERGVLTAAEMSQRADEVRKGADRFFADI